MHHTMSCAQRAPLLARAGSGEISTRTQRSSPACFSRAAAAHGRGFSDAASTSAAARGVSLGGRRSRPQTRICSTSGPWKAVTDPEGRQYFWNTETNETAWQLPQAAAAPPQPAAATAEAPAAAAASAAPTVTFPELEKILIDVSGVYLWKETEPYRDVAFGDPFTDYLTAEIAACAAKGDTDRELKLDKLRARLANPLLRQPPPFM